MRLGERVPSGMREISPDPGGALAPSLSAMSAVTAARTTTQDIQDPRADLTALQLLCELVEGPRFSAVMVWALVGMVLALAGETDYPELMIWTWCNAAVFALFFAECTVKMMGRGIAGYFCGEDWYWHIVDFAIVALGCSEMYIALCFSSSSPSLHVFRLLRLLRLYRLFKSVRQLRALAGAFREMMASFAVVFTVLFLFLLMSSMLCTRMLGHADLSTASADVAEELQRDIQAYFSDIPTSMFSLFQVTTLDNWIDIAKPAIALDARWQGFFVLFICGASWTMISILMAVASESVVESAMGREEASKKEQAEMQKEMLDFLRRAFLDADADGNGLLDRDEFEQLIRREDVIEKMSISAALTPEDLLQAWESLDVNRTGELTIDEFVSGFAMMNEGLSAKHIATFDFALQRAGMDTLGRLQRLTGDLAKMKSQNEQALSKLERQKQRHEAFVDQLWSWKAWALREEDLDPELRLEIEKLERPPKA